jgi:hypothetical protein
MDIEEIQMIGKQRGEGQTEICDPETTVSQLITESLGEFGSRRAMKVFGIATLLMVLIPWVLYYPIVEWFGLSVEIWGVSSIVGLHGILAWYSTLAYKENAEEAKEEVKTKSLESKKDK